MAVLPTRGLWAIYSSTMMCEVNWTLSSRVAVTTVQLLLLGSTTATTIETLSGMQFISLIV